MLVTYVTVGLSGLGVPYILQIGLWALAVASVVTLGQRMIAVRRGMAAAAPAGAAGPGDGAGPGVRAGHAID